MVLQSVLGDDKAEERTIQLADAEPRFQTGINFLRNPGFDDDVTGWSASPAPMGRLTHTVPGRTGSGAAVLTAIDRATTVTLTDTPDAVSWTGRGLTYIGNIWVQTSAPGTRVQLKLTEMDGRRTAARSWTNITLTDQRWQRIEVSLKAAGTGHRMDFTVIANNVPAGKFVYADDASLLIAKPGGQQPTAPASPPPTQGPGSPPSPAPPTVAPPTVAPPTAAPGNGYTPIPAGMPNASNTGVRPGTVLTVLSGDQRITRAGTVIENRDVRGCIRVEADNVVIRNSKVSCRGGGSPVIYTVGSGLVVEDVTIDGQAGSGSGLAPGNFTARRVNISNSADGFYVNENVLIEDSYVHHLARIGESHNDAVQSTGGSNIVLRRNTLIPINESTGESMNAGYMFGQNFGPIAKVTFDGNFINGGGYTLNGAGDVTFVNNRFGRNCIWGIKYFRENSQVKFDNSNVWADTGRPVNEDPSCK
ncbi:right-handed parallel beta-helix repeat-containing protein [Frankia sp. Cpl3]|nr:right-handed parallel beta-helix repeat-containing protein [Frankia sp. Cpl3]